MSLKIEFLNYLIISILFYYKINIKYCLYMMSHSIYNIYRIYSFSGCIPVDHLIRVDNLSFHYFVLHLHFSLKELIFVDN